MNAAEIFEAHRPRLLAIGYRMLGNRAEAEDCVQDAWLRFAGVDVTTLESPVAWLTTTVSRLCLDALRSRKVRQEAYVGPWLPEPWMDEPEPLTADAAQELELADDLSMAFLLLLERLSPEERTAFLLHDVFDVSFTEIAGIVEKREDSIRQTVSRARQRVAAERPRFRASIRQQQELAAKFMQAVALRDPVALAGLFLPDAVMINDGGGKALAALRPIRGADRIAKFFLGVTRDLDLTRVNPSIEWMNDGVAIILREEDGTVSIALGLDVRDERIAAAYGVRNPDKLAHV